MAKIKSLSLELQKGTDRTVAATWDFTDTQKTNVDYYKVTWHYYTGNGYGYEGDTQEVKQTKNSAKLNSTYTAPSNARGCRAWVKAVSKTYKKNGKEAKYFTCDWKKSSEYYFSNNPPETPSAPTVSIGDSANSEGKYKLTASLTNITDSNTDYLEFRFYKGTGKIDTVFAKKSTQAATAYTYISGGSSKYKSRVRAINDSAKGDVSEKITLISGTNVTLKNAVYGSFSEYSSEVTPPPDAPTNLKGSAETESSVKLTWTKGSGASGYDIQYAKEKAYLQKSSNEVSTTSVETNTDTAYVTGLESGEEWFFRIRATNDSGSSGWSDIVSVIIGTTPEAPTTWSSTTTAMYGETVNLYWVHNCEDGSDQTAARIELIFEDDSKKTIDISGDTREYSLNTEEYEADTEIKWRVCTKGIMPDYGEWSITRTIKVIAPATLALYLPNDDDLLTSFPYVITAEAGPESQKAISFYISVYAKTSYETTAPTGETVYVSEGDEIYSSLYNTSLEDENTIDFILSAGNITLESGEEYRVVVTVAMDSGLTAEAETEFTVEWDDVDYDPDASLCIDFINFVAYIAPYCYDDYIPESEDEDPDDYPEPDLTQGITLAVYRRDADGGFTLIGDDIANDGIANLTDPHPALDYARYRVVAQDDATGQISYNDLPGFPVNQPYVVMQWDETYSDFDYDGMEDIEDDVDEISWAGSMIKIKGNVDISESHDTDTELIEYIGRENPVSYYGTQIGESGTWSVEIDKTDEETVGLLRRLSKYMGDVYVREPSGLGYWAHVQVSMNTNHCETVIPVTFNISRVEGGV